MDYGPQQRHQFLVALAIFVESNRLLLDYIREVPGSSAVVELRGKAVGVYILSREPLVLFLSSFKDRRKVIDRSERACYMVARRHGKTWKSTDRDNQEVYGLSMEVFRTV